jgi:predicted 3-demethylubiquinone-9 3-methyltransferase (glyoxalase superfamily)
MATVHPFLWFNLDAGAARDFYLSVFKNGRALETITFTDNVGRTDKPHAIFDFELEGQRFTALNAGGVPPFNERISLYIETKDQAETDYYWNALTAGSGSEQPCGWLKDKFGVFWQVIPGETLRLMNDPDREKAARARRAMYSMKKIVLADIEAAHAGRA